MATSPVTRGTPHTRGTSAVAIDGLSGHILENFGRKNNGEISVIKDNDGQEVTVTFFNKTVQIRFTALVKTTGGLALPDGGDAVTLDGLACHYDWGAEKLWEREGFAKISATATYRPNLGA